MPSATKVQTGYLEAVNPFTLSPGTSSLPTLTFSTSSATGIFSPSAGVIGFSTGNTQNALSILANGNVGIGTNNPSNLLTLGASGGPTMRFTDTTSGVFSILIGGSNGDLTFSADHGNIGSSTNIIFSNDGNQERLRITSSGNVGIGTTNPQAKLDVQGGSNSTIRIGRTSSYGDFGKIELNDSRSYIYSEIQPGTAFGDTFLTFGTQNNGTTTEKVRITREGNVGIGTNNPQAKLDVNGSAQFGSNVVNTTSIQKLFTPSHDATNRGAKIRFGLSDGSFGGIEVENVQGSIASFNSQTVHIINHNGGVLGDIKSLTARFDGIVTMPYTPAFCANNINDAFINGNIVLNNVKLNNGNHYSNVTGNFTAPVAGMYYFSFTGFVQNNNTGGADISIQKNGVPIVRTFTNEAGGEFRPFAVDCIVYLSVGDTVRPTSGVDLHGNANPNFSGHLIG